MTPNYTTIITPVLPGRVDALKVYLRERVNPQPTADGGLRCLPTFPFDAIEGLHFCSLLVLDADPEEGIPAQLVLDATFDASRANFLDALIARAGEGMRAVYTHCGGQPKSGIDEKESFKRYLLSHDVGANTYFSGSRGRTVAQIKAESRLRSRLVEYLASWRLSQRPMPNSNVGLHEAMQDEIRQIPDLAWAQKPAPVPWEVRYRKRTWAIIEYVILAGAIALGGLLLWGLGVPFAELTLQAKALLAYSQSVGLSLAAYEWPSLAERMPEPVLYAVLLPSAVWFVMRTLELVLGRAAADPHRVRLPLNFLLNVVWLVRRALTLLLLAMAGVAIIAPFPGGYLSGRAVAAGLILAAFAQGLLRYFAISLQLARQRDQASAATESVRQFALDVLLFLRITIVFLVVLVLLHAAGTELQKVDELLAIIVPWGIAAVFCWFAGVLAFLMLLALLALAIRIRELVDARRFRPATALTAEALNNAAARAREEGGTNLYQNHLASITYVKPGLFRLWLLRATLFSINLLSRFWFNVGELGDISTILSARWVIIDGGRRLIFLDNYTGGWESYLNEFIDMGAVKGLNAIWTNSFIKWPPASGNRYAFPATRFYISKGAQDERPFKAYVRLSQIETIAWYSAYNRLSITNVNDSTKIRQSLSQPLASYEVDDLIGKL